MIHIRAALVFFILTAASVSAAAEPLKTMEAVGDALQACWTAPDTKGAVTLSFSIRRDGSLIGPPKPMAINVEGDADVRKAFVNAAVGALTKCTPLDLSPELAAGIAGSVYSMQFTSPASMAAPVSN